VGYIREMRLAMSMLVLSAAVAAVGCGSSGSTTGTDATAPRMSSSSQTDKARALAYAHAVNLKASDVPGARVSATERESGVPSREGVQFARCAGGVSPTVRISDVKSPKFTTGEGRAAMQVKSSVEVLPSAALAARNFAAVGSARGHACLVRALPEVFGAAAGGHFGRATISPLPSLLRSERDNFGIRISTSLTSVVAGKQVRLRVYLDTFEILAGPAEVGMGVTSVSRAPSRATERRLLMLLAKRAEQHEL
jgi:hypothetical protein